MTAETDQQDEHCHQCGRPLTERAKYRHEYGGLRFCTLSCAEDFARYLMSKVKRP